jgi:serine/threonine protein phosphatase 1
MHASRVVRPPIARFAPNTRGRDFAVGDIHGAFRALQIALDAIGFDCAADRLFSVGDLVDRGPESARVTEWLDKPWFHAI